MGGLRNAYKIFVRRDLLEDLGIGGTIILKYILKKFRFKSRYRTVVIFFEQSNKPLH